MSAAPTPPAALCAPRTSSQVGPRSAAAALPLVLVLLLAATTLVSDAWRAIAVIVAVAPGTAAATSRFCPTSHCLVVAVGVGGALGATERGGR